MSKELINFNIATVSYDQYLYDEFNDVVAFMELKYEGCRYSGGSGVSYNFILKDGIIGECILCDDNKWKLRVYDDLEPF